jgi:hypothetical protein
MNPLTCGYKIYEENNIFHLIVHESAVIRYDDVLNIEQYIKSKTSRDQLKLIDVRAISIIDEKARHFLDSPKIKYRVLAQAILVGANTNQNIIDFYQELNSKKTESKIFVNYDVAIEWLNSFQTTD